MLKVSPHGTDATSLRDHPPGEQPGKKKTQTQAKKTPNQNKQERQRKDTSEQIVEAVKSKMQFCWQHPLHSIPCVRHSNESQWMYFHSKIAKQNLKFHKEKWWATSRYLTICIACIITLVYVKHITHMCMHKWIPVFILKKFSICFVWLVFTLTVMLLIICSVRKKNYFPFLNTVLNVN